MASGITCLINSRVVAVLMAVTRDSDVEDNSYSSETAVVCKRQHARCWIVVVF